MPKIPKVCAIFVVIAWVSLSVLRMPISASAVPYTETTDSNARKYLGNYTALPDDATLQSVFNEDSNNILGTPDLLQVDSPEADLSLSITDFDPVFASGSSLHFVVYTLSISNAGPDSAENVHILDMLPWGYAGAETDSMWDCSEQGGWVDCSYLGTLPVGDAHDIIIWVYSPFFEGTLTNYAWITSLTPDPDESNNTDSEQTTVIFQADLSLNISDSPDIVYPGQILTYTLEVSNTGASNAENLVVTDNLPVGMTFESANGEGWSCEEESGVVTCTRASLAAENAADITITVAAPSTAGTITNNASVAADTFDYNETNNADSENTTVILWRTYLPLVVR